MKRFSISYKILILLILSAGLLPIFFAFTLVWQENEELNFIEERIEVFENKIKLNFSKHKNNIMMHKLHSNASKKYLEENLPFLPLLEGNQQPSLLFKESEYTLTKQITLDPDEIQKTISIIEGCPIGSLNIPVGRPQLIILDFRLERSQTDLSKDRFKLNTKVLKREFS